MGAVLFGLVAFAFVMLIVYVGLLIYLGVTHFFEERCQLALLATAVETSDYKVKETTHFGAYDSDILLLTIPNAKGYRNMRIDFDGEVLSPMWWEGGSTPARNEKPPRAGWCERAEEYTKQIAVMHKLKKDFNND